MTDADIEILTDNVRAQSSRPLSKEFRKEIACTVEELWREVKRLWRAVNLQR